MSDDSREPRGGSSGPLDDHRGALILPAAELAAHCNRSHVLCSKNGAPVVLEHADADGRCLITKIWRRRHLWSSDLVWPYHDRFRRALAELERLDVPVPRYRAHGRVAGGDQSFVVYERLEGTPLRDLGGRFDLKAFAAFVARLHDLGVYFRGLHLGHVIQLSDGRFGLIDVQDIKFLKHPLSRRMRERSLGILCSHPDDLVYMNGHWSELVMAYCRASNCSLAQAADMRERVRLQMERRGARRAARRGLGVLELPEYPDADRA